jgi:hypothetical protein
MPDDNPVITFSYGLGDLYRQDENVLGLQMSASSGTDP